VEEQRIHSEQPLAHAARGCFVSLACVEVPVSWRLAVSDRSVRVNVPEFVCWGGATRSRNDHGHRPAGNPAHRVTHRRRLRTRRCRKLIDQDGDLEISVVALPCGTSPVAEETLSLRLPVRVIAAALTEVNQLVAVCRV
jgi:hypothetical protein